MPGHTRTEPPSPERRATHRDASAAGRERRSQRYGSLKLAVGRPVEIPIGATAQIGTERRIDCGHYQSCLFWAAVVHDSWADFSCIRECQEYSLGPELRLAADGIASCMVGARIGADPKGEGLNHMKRWR